MLAEVLEEVLGEIRGSAWRWGAKHTPHTHT